jgi:hypothetical protein
MPETLVTLSAPRIFPLVPGNRYSETRVPVGYDTALTEWDLLVREMTGTPSLSEQARTARYPSGMPVSLAAPADCACGHSEFAHQHYRPGADCSLCGCQAYRPVLP